MGGWENQRITITLQLLTIGFEANSGGGDLPRNRKNMDKASIAI